MKLKRKQIVSPTYEVDPSITMYECNQKKEVEELFSKMLEHSFISTSNITGEPIDTVRTSDIYRVLCDFFAVDGKETSYSEYN